MVDSIFTYRKTCQEVLNILLLFKQTSAQAAVEESERIFNEILLSIEEKCSKMTALIRAQEESQLNQAEELIEQLELEITDLKKRETDLELLSQTEDHVHFLQVIVKALDFFQHKLILDHSTCDDALYI